MINIFHPLKIKESIMLKYIQNLVSLIEISFNEFIDLMILFIIKIKNMKYIFMLYN
jgi:hypothetical protein